MVKYSFLVKINDTTVTSIIETGKTFSDCCASLEFRLLERCGFESYEILSVQKI